MNIREAGNINPFFSKEGQEQLGPSCEFCLIPETRGTELFRKFYGMDQVIGSVSVDPSMILMQDVVPLGEDGAHLLLFPKRIR